MLKQRFWQLFHQHNRDFIQERRETAARWMTRARLLVKVSDDEGDMMDAALTIMWCGLDNLPKMINNKTNP